MQIAESHSEDEMSNDDCISSGNDGYIYKKECLRPKNSNEKIFIIKFTLLLLFKDFF